MVKDEDVMKVAVMKDVKGDVEKEFEDGWDSIKNWYYWPESEYILNETCGSTCEPIYHYSTHTLMDGSGFLWVWVWVALPIPRGIPMLFPRLNKGKNPCIQPGTARI